MPRFALYTFGVLKDVTGSETLAPEPPATFENGSSGSIHILQLTDLG